MGTNAVLVPKSWICTGGGVHGGKINAAICWEIEIHCRFKMFTYRFYAFNLGVEIQRGPNLV
jgi:hypothetical protein